MNPARTPPKGLSSSDTNLNRPITSSVGPIPASKITMRANSKRGRVEDSDECKGDECNSFDMFRNEMKDMLSNWMKQHDKKLEKLDKGLAKLDNLEMGISDIKTGMKLSNDEIEKSLGVLSAQMKDLDIKIDSLDREWISTRAKVEELEERTESIERVIRKTSLEIRGVPKKKKEKREDLLNMVNCLIKSVGSDCSNEIKDIYRLPSKANATTSAVVAEFTNTFAKDKLLKVIKQYNTSRPGSQINTRHIGLEGPEMTLFISEHLTPKAKRLLFLARDFARTENYQYCWIANGRIFLGKKEGDKYTIVRNENTFQQLRESYKIDN
ncbi:hypothetical protein PYW07_005712 [Mythimna separata]|uniref:FP protein C-terminal domain-containing protein n=1 Tax=Mythimna separata TaxID=271217 RepID=A0AAD8DS65_MYTSE|nr:hypothetical protein PYW07_005712 [Mythimna separata]